VKHRILSLWGYDVRDISRRYSFHFALLKHLERCRNIGCWKRVNGWQYLLTHAWCTSGKAKFSSALFLLVHEDRIPGNACSPHLGHSPFPVCMQIRGWSCKSRPDTPIIQQDKWFSPRRIAPLLSIFPSLQVLRHLSDIMYEMHFMFENKMLWYKRWYFLKYFVTHLAIKDSKACSLLKI